MQNLKQIKCSMVLILSFILLACVYLYTVQLYKNLRNEWGSQGYAFHLESLIRNAIIKIILF